MAADREVIREYLAALGFQVEEGGYKNFLKALVDVCKFASHAGAGLAGVAVAAEVMVQKFASGMEKLYFQGQRTRATVESLQALRFAAEDVGVSGDEAVEALEAMQAQMRITPGMQTVLKHLGVDPEDAEKGRDSVKVMYDLIRKLRELEAKGMPHGVAAEWAGMFGIQERTYLMLSKNLEKLEEADKQRRAMNRDAGVDAEKWAKDSHELMVMWRTINEQLEISEHRVAAQLLPFFRQLYAVVALILEDWAKIDFTGMGDSKMLRGFIGEQLDKWGAWGRAIDFVITGLERLIELTKKLPMYRQGAALLRFLDRSADYLFPGEEAPPESRNRTGRIGGRGPATAGAPSTGPGRDDDALPPGITPWRIENGKVVGGVPPETEGERLSRAMLALGLLKSELSQAQTDAEAISLGREIARTQAMVDRLGAPTPPPAVAGGGGGREVSGKIGPVSLDARTNIYVSGAGEPGSVGRSVAGEQGRVYADLVRNMRGALS